MTRGEFKTRNASLLDVLETMASDREWTTEDWQDHGFTMAFIGKKGEGIKVIETHAWSWNGAIPTKAVEVFLREAREGEIMHLSDPVRPDRRDE